MDVPSLELFGPDALAGCVSSLLQSYSCRRDPDEDSVQLLGMLLLQQLILEERVSVSIPAAARLPLLQLLPYTSASLSAAHVAALAGEAAAAAEGCGSGSGSAGASVGRAQQHAERSRRLFDCHERVMALVARLLCSGAAAVAAVSRCVLRTQVLRTHSRVAARACAALPADPEPLLNAINDACRLLLALAAVALTPRIQRDAGSSCCLIGPAAANADGGTASGDGGGISGGGCGCRGARKSTGVGGHKASMLLEELSESGFLEHAARLLLYSTQADGQLQRRRRGDTFVPVLRCLDAGLVAAYCWMDSVRQPAAGDGADTATTGIARQPSAAATAGRGSLRLPPPLPWGTCLRTLALSQVVATLAAAGFGGGARGVWGLPEDLATGLPVPGVRGAASTACDLRPQMQALLAEQQHTSASQELSGGGGGGGGDGGGVLPLLLWLSPVPFALLAQLLQADTLQPSDAVQQYRGSDGLGSDGGSAGGDGGGGTLGTTAHLPWPVSRRALTRVCLRVVDLAAASTEAAADDEACPLQQQPATPCTAGQPTVAEGAAAAAAAAAEAAAALAGPVAGSPALYQLRLPARQALHAATDALMSARWLLVDDGQVRHAAAAAAAAAAAGAGPEAAGPEAAGGASGCDGCPPLPRRYWQAAVQMLRMVPQSMAAVILPNGPRDAAEAAGDVSIDNLCNTLQQALSTTAGPDTEVLLHTAPASLAAALAAGLLPALEVVLRRTGDTEAAVRVAMSALAVAKCGGSSSGGSSGGGSCFCWQLLQRFMAFAPPRQTAALITSMGKRLSAAVGELHDHTGLQSQSQWQGSGQEEGDEQQAQETTGWGGSRCVAGASCLAHTVVELLPPLPLVARSTMPLVALAASEAEAAAAAAAAAAATVGGGGGSGHDCSSGGGVYGGGGLAGLLGWASLLAASSERDLYCTRGSPCPPASTAAAAGPCAAATPPTEEAQQLLRLRARRVRLLWSHALHRWLPALSRLTDPLYGLELYRELGSLLGWVTACNVALGTAEAAAAALGVGLGVGAGVGGSGSAGGGAAAANHTAAAAAASWRHFLTADVDCLGLLHNALSQLDACRAEGTECCDLALKTVIALNVTSLALPEEVDSRLRPDSLWLPHEVLSLFQYHTAGCTIVNGAVAGRPGGGGCGGCGGGGATHNVLAAFEALAMFVAEEETSGRRRGHFAWRDFAGGCAARAALSRDLLGSWEVLLPLSPREVADEGLALAAAELAACSAPAAAAAAAAGDQIVAEMSNSGGPAEPGAGSAPAAPVRARAPIAGGATAGLAAAECHAGGVASSDRRAAASATASATGATAGVTAAAGSAAPRLLDADVAAAASLLPACCADPLCEALDGDSELLQPPMWSYCPGCGGAVAYCSRACERAHAHACLQ